MRDYCRQRVAVDERLLQTEGSRRRLTQSGLNRTAAKRVCLPSDSSAAVTRTGQVLMSLWSAHSINTKDTVDS